MGLFLRHFIDEKRFAWRFINDEVIVLDFITGDYYKLNDVGAVIWKEIVKRRSLEEILETIQDAYDVSAARAKSDLMDLVAKLEEEKLIARI